MDAQMTQMIPTSVLKLARDRADMSQTDLASVLEVAPSVVSRLEASEHADQQMASRYLSAVNTPLAREIVNFYKERWRCIERPSFTHPERQALRDAELAMQSLDEFERTPQFDPILKDPVQRLRSRLASETEFLRHLEHGIAFVGDIGVGKTTALSFVTNLVTPAKSGPSQSIFPTGSGRTTVCEVAIKIAPAFGIAVESLAEEEIRALVADLVQGLKSNGSGLPSELERAIRNMADLRRIIPRAKTGSERAVVQDPLREMVAAAEDMDQVVAEFMSRMKLGTRTETQMILSANNEGSMEWLASNIAKINYGQHPSFSIPQRITVLLPLKSLRETPYRLTVIDTKGIEGTTQRADITAQIEDPRTLTVLCCKFPDAPGATSMSILREILDSGSDAVLSERICLLVLPRDQEAIKIIDDAGGNPSSAGEGYAIRQAQIVQQFATEGLPAVPISFFNIDGDDPSVTWAWLASILSRIRSNKVVRLARLVAAARDLISNSDIAKTRQARRAILATMEQAAKRLTKLSEVVRPAHSNLVLQAKKVHQSSIAASVNRRGKWNNFQAAHILGVGVQTDANLRTRETFVRLDEQIEGLKVQYKQLRDIAQFLQSLKDDIAEWRQEFLLHAALVGRVSYAPYLQSANELWANCMRRYGAGAGYRIDVSDILLKHFEEDKAARAANKSVEISLQKSWEEIVIAKLRAAVRYQEDDGDA
jgi:transcriptional regulator with XRE-family HTH domain